MKGEKKEQFYQQADPVLYGVLKEYARENRKNMTDAERELWRYLKRDALGVTFLRQYIIGEYIVDFACLKAHLIIEVDGGYHSEPRQDEDDKIRQQWLEEQGYTVIRFKNEEILGGIDKVIEEIKRRSTPALLKKEGEKSTSILTERERKCGSRVDAPSFLRRVGVDL